MPALTHYQTYPERPPGADLPPKKVCNLGPMAPRSRMTAAHATELLSPELSLLGETFDARCERCEGRFLKSRYESFVKLRQKQQPHSAIERLCLKPVRWNIPECSALFPRPATVENANKRQHTADDRW